MVCYSEAGSKDDLGKERGNSSLPGSDERNAEVFFQVRVHSPWKHHPAQKHQDCPLTKQRGLQAEAQKTCPPPTLRPYMPFLKSAGRWGMDGGWGKTLEPETKRRQARFLGQTPLAQAMGKVCRCLQGPGGPNIF